MATKLPPLKSLEAFVAVGRVLSVKLAADQLAITSSAVSHRLRLLEDQLGVRLFERLNRGLRLTPAGERYLQIVGAAFERIEEGTSRLREASVSGELTVYVVHALAANWIMPRLSEFYARHPDIRLAFQPKTSREYAATSPEDLRGSVQIRFGRGDWKGFHCERIVGGRTFPVCSPSLRDGMPGLRRLEDLAQHVWIHVNLYPQAWSEWLAVAGLPGLRPRGEMHVADPELKHQAAVHALGVGLGNAVLVQPYLRSGDLVAPFGIVHETAEGYHLVCHPDSVDDPRIRALAEWLKLLAAEPVLPMASGIRALSRTAVA